LSQWGGEASYNELVQILAQLKSGIPVTVSSSGGTGTTVDVIDKALRQLGIVSVSGGTGILVGGVLVDPRSIRPLTLADLITVVVSGGTAVTNFPAFPNYYQVRGSGGSGFLIIDTNGQIGINNLPTAIEILGSGGTGYLLVDAGGRIGAVAYGSQTQQLLQRAATYDLLVQLRNAGAEIDPRSIRALTSSDVVTIQDYLSGLTAMPTTKMARQINFTYNSDGSYNTIVYQDQSGATAFTLTFAYSAGSTISITRT
jgi:hypothetical protein